MIQKYIVKLLFYLIFIFIIVMRTCIIISIRNTDFSHLVHVFVEMGNTLWNSNPSVFECRFSMRFDP